MKLLGKISAKEILGNVNVVVREMKVGDVRQAYGVAGICDAYETGVSQFGEWHRFIGGFQAVNYVTGEEIRASKAHIPQVLEELLLNGIRESSEVESARSTKHTTFYKMTSPVEFAFEVGIERLEDGENGELNYKYITSPKTEMKRNDAISHLTALLSPPESADAGEETIAPEETIAQAAPKTKPKPKK